MSSSSFSIDWAAPQNATFVSVPAATASSFDSDLCSFNACIPQPSPGELLDPLSQFTMFRAMYRNFGTHEALVISHTVDADGVDTAGVRWAELRKSGGNWVINQEGTYAPADGNHRWIPSIAMDGDGNIAVAYSLSGTSTFPSVAYATRASNSTAAPGVLDGTEMMCQAGTGSQQSSFNRWGDYSSISVDPADDCTFWLTSEYYQDSGAFDFKTRICSFKMPGCGSSSCTSDQDGDGVCDSTDNCLLTSNPGQADSDGDGIGDACDVCALDPDNDVDGDGLCADVDPCPDDPDNVCSGPGDTRSEATADFSTPLGSTSGSFQDTWTQGGGVQVITEEAKTKGNPRSRKSQADHRWTYSTCLRAPAGPSTSTPSRAWIRVKAISFDFPGPRTTSTSSLT